ncbi:MAG: PglZ domain-containing protein [Hyphomicrobiales bacterium]|nr:PglZ domain-containing protein [Hyphomicrobiales bacterium]
MSHLLHDYVAQQLEGHIRDRGIVVWFDPRGEFETFVAELTPSDSGAAAAAALGELSIEVARFDGSMYALRSLVEPRVGGDAPEPTLVYLAGVERRDDSPLMELETAGVRWEPQLRRLARNALRQRFTDGVIDELLSRDNLTYQDIADAAGVGGPETPSVLKTILTSASSEGQIAQWLAAAETDAAILDKGADEELRKLLVARLGLDVGDADLSKLRSIAARFVLGAEFRSDLTAEAGAELAELPVVTSDVEQRVRAITALLRRDHADAYPEIADRTQVELSLSSDSIDATALGSIDTFSFEERSLLDRCAQLIREGEYNQVLDIVAERRTSFWLAHEVERQAQWEAIRLAAELGRAAAEVETRTESATPSAADWINRYASEWHRLDRAQRKLEAWLPKLDDDPDELALTSVRHRYESVLDKLSTGFTTALAASSWSVEGVVAQTSVFDDLVRPDKGRVAYFLVDAMRYEMGAELAERLDDFGETVITPAVGVLPSITTTGMAALMPGARTNYVIADHSGGLTPEVDGAPLRDLKARKKHLAARVPSSVDLTLEDVLQLSKAKLTKKVGAHDLIVVRSQEIDLFGEGGSSLARSVMDTVIDNLARAVRKLAGLGVSRAVVASDHGHLFAAEDRDDSMKIEAPGGDQVELHRRCWVGRGGSTPPGCARISARELGSDSDLDFVFPATAGVFKAGGDLSFHHGGPTLQEMVIPVITFRAHAAEPMPATNAEMTVSEVPEVITNRMFSVKLAYATLLGADLPVMPVLMSDGRQVGAVGMALDAELQPSGAVALGAASEATLGFRLDDDGVESVQIVILDPMTDAVLYRSPTDISVELGVV